eukprot:m.186648 g.186648  ORF g.186648 m.186648 type:complete len:247 (+) comp14759_c0_seq3:2445-3185(+)
MIQQLSDKESALSQQKQALAVLNLQQHQDQEKEHMKQKKAAEEGSKQMSVDVKASAVAVSEGVLADASATQQSTEEPLHFEPSETGDDGEVHGSDVREREQIASASAVIASASPQPKPSVRFHSPPRTIMKGVFKALETFNMIQDGDRVLLCISGGKVCGTDMISIATNCWCVCFIIICFPQLISLPSYQRTSASTCTSIPPWSALFLHTPSRQCALSRFHRVERASAFVISSVICICACMYFRIP